MYEFSTYVKAYFTFTPKNKHTKTTNLSETWLTSLNILINCCIGVICLRKNRPFYDRFDVHLSVRPIVINKLILIEMSGLYLSYLYTFSYRRLSKYLLLLWKSKVIWHSLSKSWIMFIKFIMTSFDNNTQSQ